MPAARSRFSFSGAWLAIPVAIALAPAFLRAPTEAGVDALATASVVVAASTTLAIALGAHRRSSAASIGALAIGPALAMLFAARVAADRALAAGIPSEGSFPLLTTFVALALAAIGARAVELGRARRAVRAGAGLITIAVALAAAALHAVVVARGEAPSAADALARIQPAAVLEVMLDDDAQTTRLEPHLELRRSCTGNYCELVARVDHGDGDEVASRRPLADQLDRAPLAIVPLGGVVAVMPVDRDRQLDWSRAMGFSTETARPAEVDVSAIGARLAPPRSWRIASLVGLALALAALALAARARRAHRRIADGADAVVGADGTMRLPRGEIARAPRELAAGPAVVLDRATTTPTYREDGLAAIAHALPGTRAAWLERLADRALGLELAALGAILLTHAPLLAAWDAGYAVLGR